MKFLSITALTCYLFTSVCLANDETIDLNNVKQQTEDLYRTGSGSTDGTFSAVSLSMLGWGVGLAAGIAILASAIHQSSSSSHDSSCSH